MSRYEKLFNKVWIDKITKIDNFFLSHFDINLYRKPALASSPNIFIEGNTTAVFPHCCDLSNENCYCTQCKIHIHSKYVVIVIKLS